MRSCNLRKHCPEINTRRKHGWWSLDTSQQVDSSFNDEVNRHELLRTVRVWGRDFIWSSGSPHYRPQSKPQPKHFLLRPLQNTNTPIAVLFPSTDCMRAWKQRARACDLFMIVHHNHHDEILAAGWFIGVICHCFDWGQRKHLLASDLICAVCSLNSDLF